MKKIAFPAFLTTAVFTLVRHGVHPDRQPGQQLAVLTGRGLSASFLS